MSSRKEAKSHLQPEEAPPAGHKKQASALDVLY